MRYFQTTRKARRLLNQVATERRTRRVLPRIVVNPTGPFAQRVKPSARLYRRHPRHRERDIAEHFA